MNIKKRFRNVTFDVTMAVTIIAFVYQMCGMLGVTAPISQETVVQYIGLAGNILVGLGVLVDPTTSGIKDYKTE